MADRLCPKALESPGSFDISFRIMKMLATMAGGATLWDIEHGLKKQGVKASHPTFHSVIQTLLRDKMINIVRTEPFRAGNVKKYYGITREGFKFALRHTILEGREWDPHFFYDNAVEISKVNPQLSPILQKVPEWRMESTPGLLKAFIAVSTQEDDESPESIARLAAMMILIGDDEKIVRALGVDEADWGFNIDHDLASLRKELKIFANNNPWILADLRRGAAQASRQALKDAKYLEQQAKEFEQLSQATDEQILAQLKK